MVHADATYETPLRWPDGRPRTTHPRRAPFRVSLAVARDSLLGELFKLGGSRVTVSSNARLGKNGLMTAAQPWTPDPGVAVWFVRKGAELCFACDEWDTIAGNLRAIGKSVEALRGLERWGSAMLDAALGGFAALPERSGDAAWWVLGVDPTATRRDIESAYRAAVREVHPDVGGDPAEFRRITEAYRALTGAGR